MIKEILLLHHSHFDYGYTHPQPVVAELAVRAIDEALDLADASAALPAGERFCWTCETTATLGWWLDRASRAQKERLRAVAARGQISCGALTFHGTPLLGYDDYRLTLEGALRAREECGLRCNVAVQHDVNGIGWPAVGILREAGVELLAMGMNLTMGALTFGRRHALFRWQGPDGREILAFHGDHYNAFGRLFRLTAPGDPLDATLWPAYEKQLREEWAWPHEWVVLTVTMNRFPDNNPPDPHLVKTVRQWNSAGGLPRVRLASLEEVAARMQSVPRDSLPVFRGDWSDYWAFGVGSSARETAVNRRTKRRLAAAESLALATRPAHRPLLQQARWASLWWDEHTWGAYHSIEGEANDTVAMQWQEKAALAWRAAGLSEIVMRDELEALAGNSATGVRPAGILLFNPSPEPAAWARRLLERLTTGEYVHSRGRAAALDAPFQTLRGTETEAAGSAAWVQGEPLPPYGWRFLPMSEALAGRMTEPETGDGCGWIANAWLSLHFDPRHGTVRSLRRRGTDEELLAHEGAFSFCQPVHEMPGNLPAQPKPPLAGREVFWTLDYHRIHDNCSTWRTDWTAIRTGAEAAGCEVVRRPGSVTLVVRWRGAGSLVASTHLTLHGHRPGIDVEFEIEKMEQPLPEALYLVFPLQMGAGWRAYGDTIDTPFEVDAEQLPGVCRDFLTVSSWLAVEGDQGCVQLCCPDAPMAAVGDFAFGRLQSAVERAANPLLLAWPLNNYWFTNFRISQPGSIRLRYQLFFDRSYNAPACVRRALAAEQQVELHPVLRLPPPDRREGALCRVTGDLVLLRIEGGCDQAIVTVMNPLSDRAEGSLALTVGSWGAPSLVDVLGKPLSDSGVDLQPTPDRVHLSLPGRRTIRCVFPATPAS